MLKYQLNYSSIVKTRQQHYKFLFLILMAKMSQSAF